MSQNITPAEVIRLGIEQGHSADVIVASLEAAGAKLMYKDAFALMWYACQCGHRERIWNSRDGIVPFSGIVCPSCGDDFQTPGGGLRHIDLDADRCAPDHKLHPGQRFWRDGTPDEAVAILERRFAGWAERRGAPLPREEQDAMLQNARTGRDGLHESEFRTGWAMLDRTPLR